MVAAVWVAGAAGSGWLPRCACFRSRPLCRLRTLAPARHPRAAANRKVLSEADVARRAEADAQSLRRELAAAQEELDKARTEGEDLKEGTSAYAS